MEVIGSIYTEVSDDFQNGIIGGCISRCVKAEKHDLGVVLMEEVKVIGQMDNTIDHTFESANRVYDIGGVAPTINTCGGGGLQPKILESVKELGFMDNGTGKHQSNTVYDENALCPNITTIQGGGTQQIKIAESQIIAMRGRNPTNPSDRTVGTPTEQRLEPNSQGICNTLTSVQKDNLVMENLIIGGEQKHQAVKKDGICTCLTSSMGTGGGYVPMIAPQYRIRKLTPLECWRLMDFSDEDFEKAAQVNSNTQLYKQAGNSIVVNVLVAILGQILPGKENVYKNKI